MPPKPNRPRPSTPPKKTAPAKPSNKSNQKKNPAPDRKSNNTNPGTPLPNKINPSTPKPQKSTSQSNLQGTIQKVSQTLEQGQAVLDKTSQLANSVTDISSSVPSLLDPSLKKITDDILKSQLQRAKEIDRRFSPTKEPDTYRLNYIPANRFYVEMDGQVKASFKEFSGIGVNLKKESYLEGGVNHQQRVMLGHAEFSDITLKRGMTDDGIFLTWVMQTLLGQPKNRRNINILLFNQAGETMQCFTLIGAIPISWKSPGFQADGNSVAIEELTLAYEGLNVSTKTPGGGPTLNIKRDDKGFFPDK